MSKEATTDRNGVEVQIPVKDSVDEFRNKALDFYKFCNPGTVKINGETTMHYDCSKEKRKWLRRPSTGLIALQGHGNRHRPEFRNIRIKPLED